MYKILSELSMKDFISHLDHFNIFPILKNLIVIKKIFQNVYFYNMTKIDPFLEDRSINAILELF